MAGISSIRICIVSPSIYPLFNPMAHGLFQDAELQLYEMARFFGGDPRIEVNVLTGDYGQDDVEFSAGALVFRGEFDVRQNFMERLFHKKTPLQNLLAKIDADIYVMAGASGLARPVADFCRTNNRSFLFRIVEHRDCDGTFVYGDPEGESYRWALHQADVILCQTEEQKKLLQRTEHLAAVRVPNLVRLQPPSDALRTDVLWIGEAVEWRQPELFYRLALTIPHQNFTLLTRPDNPDYFERLVSKTRDVPNLGFENSVPYHEWPILMQRARLLVNTSRYEGFPFSFSLAFASSVPVASLNIDPDGMLEKKQLGICAHGSEVHLAQGVADIISYPRQWKRFSDNAYQFARNELNPETAVESYRKVFVHCVVKRRRKKAKRGQ
ncbi:MAG: glycosyltransferase family 4 protein [Candidatus Omnitrophica bacterium]|nr:glycosyltransferase family 4 protein [Candidatus Omnitrophota bacterium]